MTKDFKQQFKKEQKEQKDLTPEERAQLDAQIAEESAQLTKDVEYFRLKKEAYKLSVELGAMSPHNVPGLLGMELIASHYKYLAEINHFMGMQKQAEAARQQEEQSVKTEEKKSSIIQP